MKHEYMKKLMEWITGMIAWSNSATKAFRPISGGRISYNSIEKLLKEKEIKNFQITDSYYNLISRTDMIDFLGYNFAELREYAKDTYDCDNFSAVLYGQMSYILSGFAVGIVHVKTRTGAHALNFFIDKYRRWYYIEPQTGKMFSFYSGTQKGYNPYFALI